MRIVYERFRNKGIYIFAQNNWTQKKVDKSTFDVVLNMDGLWTEFKPLFLIFAPTLIEVINRRMNRGRCVLPSKIGCPTPGQPCPFPVNCTLGQPCPVTKVPCTTTGKACRAIKHVVCTSKPTISIATWVVGAAAAIYATYDHYEVSHN
jgi:hypothetical protein